MSTAPSSPKMPPPRRRDEKPTIIKKYANRRLYDTGRSSYVTLEDLCEMVKEGRDFIVHDAKTNEDLTHAVLTQIIVEQEGGSSQHLLPIPFLRQLIAFYGDKLQTVVPDYLEQSFGVFTQNQQQFRDQLGKSLGDLMRDPVTAMAELHRQNLEMIQNAMYAWAAPFAAPATAARTEQSAAGPSDVEPVNTEPAGESVQALQKKVADLQAELDRRAGSTPQT